MTDLTEKAARLLRGSASAEDAATFAVASACFMAMLRKHPTPRESEAFQQALIEAADVLEPLCPHCGKPVKVVTQNETASEPK